MINVPHRFRLAACIVPGSSCHAIRRAAVKPCFPA